MKRYFSLSIGAKQLEDMASIFRVRTHVSSYCWPLQTLPS